MEFEFFILDWIQTHLRHPILDPIIVFITTLGNAGILWIGLTILLAVRKSTRKTAAALAVALGLCLLCGNLLLKPLIGRIRPFNVQDAITLLIAAPLDYSFPSGHTLCSVIGAYMLTAANRKFGLAAIPLAALIAFSRLYLYVHFPSDVLASLSIGMLIGKLTTTAADSMSRRTRQA